MTGTPDAERFIEELRGGAPAEREAAAMSLAELGDAAALDPLIAALQDDDERVRTASDEALGILGDRSASDALDTVMRTDPVSRVRAASAAALGALADEAWRDGLAMVAVSDPDERVRLAAREALDALVPQS